MFSLSRFIFSSLASCFLLGLCGCSQQPSTDTKKSRLVLDWMPNPNHIPLFVGLQRGIFTKHGVDLEILRAYDADDVFAFLASGRVELAVCTMPNILRALDQNYPVTYVASVFDRPLIAFVARRDRGVEVFEDLNGCSLGAGFGMFTTAVVDSVENHTQVKFAQRKRVAFDLVPALVTGQVDAIVGAFWNIEVEQLRHMNVPLTAFRIDELDDLGVPPYHDVVIVSEEHFSYQEAFRKALDESIHFCQQFPDEAFELYMQANPEKGRSVREWEEKAWAATVPILASSQGVKEELWRDVWQWMVESGCRLRSKEFPEKILSSKAVIQSQAPILVSSDA